MIFHQMLKLILRISTDIEGKVKFEESKDNDAAVDSIY